MSERIFENLGLKFFFKQIPDLNSNPRICSLFCILFLLPIPKLISSSFCVATHAKVLVSFILSNLNSPTDLRVGLLKGDSTLVRGRRVFHFLSITASVLKKKGNEFICRHNNKILSNPFSNIKNCIFLLRN